MTISEIESILSHILEQPLTQELQELVNDIRQVEVSSIQAGILCTEIIMLRRVSSN